MDKFAYEMGRNLQSRGEAALIGGLGGAGLGALGGAGLSYLTGRKKYLKDMIIGSLLGGGAGFMAGPHMAGHATPSMSDMIVDTQKERLSNIGNMIDKAPSPSAEPASEEKKPIYADYVKRFMGQGLDRATAERLVDRIRNPHHFGGQISEIESNTLTPQLGIAASGAGLGYIGGKGIGKTLNLPRMLGLSSRRTSGRGTGKLGAIIGALLALQYANKKAP
jgi:hypothetical protein